MCKQNVTVCVEVGLRRAAWSSPAELRRLGDGAACGGAGQAWQACPWDPSPCSSPAESATPAEPAAAESRTASAPRLARGFRAWMLLAFLLGLRSSWHRWTAADQQAEAEATQSADLAALEDGAARSFLQAGALYQNDYMTLWNANEVAISATLRISEENRFEMRVEHLDSVNRGNDGWFAIKGTFGFEALPGTSGNLRLLVEIEDGPEGFTYDPTLLDRPTAFAYRCLEKVSGNVGRGLLSALEMQVDPEQDAVLVSPRAAAVRMLWAEPVVLRLTSEERLWQPSLPEAEEQGEGSAGPASAPLAV